MRKVIVCLVIVVMLVVQVMPQRAEANPAVLAAGLVPPAAAVLVAAGVTVGAAAGLDALARWWYSEAGQDVRDQLAADWAAAVDGVMQVSDSVWRSVRDWVQSKFAVGAGSITITGYVSRSDVYANLKAYLGAGWVAGQYWTEVYSGESTTVYRLYKGSELIFSKTAADWKYTGFPIAVYNDNIIAIMIFGDAENALSTYDVIAGSYNDYVVAYTGADVISNPTWDYAGCDGKRLVGVPPVIDDLVGKTYTDVIVTGDATVPGDTTVPGTTTGEYTGVLDSILSKISSIADALTTGLIGDISSVQFPQVPSITNKFPFSLPWDFARMIGLLYASPECPHINMSIGPPFNSVIDIDLSQILPDTIMSKVRLLELIAFGLGLVLVTRRLLGGAE